MKPCAPYLYEFLWRGRPPGEDDAYDENPAAWHVQIEQRLALGKNEGAIPHVRTLNMTQAIAAGWDLKKISGTINAATLAELEVARATIDSLRRDFEEAGAALVGLRARVDALEGKTDGKG
jgi:hypothetical protein